MNEQVVLQKLKEWAEKTESVRALILTSSRVSSEAVVDIFSDYDVEMYVTSLKEFDSDDWLDTFGEILVKWPKKPSSTGFRDDHWITRLVMFEGRLRIDFQITDHKEIDSSAYDSGYQVIIDKDGMTTNISEPTHTEHLVKKPTEEEFLTLVNDFFWDGTYVPKYLWRGSLFFAKRMFASSHFEYFETMIKWYIGSKNNWNVNVGAFGKYFEKYLDKETWEEIKHTYAGADTEENWTAFFKLFELFTRFARDVSDDLGYNYPLEQEKKLRDYLHESKNIK
jgi:aminoglycoside 6-adenylyltransferase